MTNVFQHPVYISEQRYDFTAGPLRFEIYAANEVEAYGRANKRVEVLNSGAWIQTGENSYNWVEGNFVD